MKIIDGMDNLSPEEKELVKKEIQQLLDASRFHWPHACGFFGSCKEWVEEYWERTKAQRARLQTMRMRRLFQVKQMFWNTHVPTWLFIISPLSTVPWELVTPGHAAIEIEFADGTIIYLDDGNLGDDDHVFVPNEVPSNYYPCPGFP